MVPSGEVVAEVIKHLRNIKDDYKMYLGIKNLGLRF